MTKVPASDVFEAIELIVKLVNLKPGESIDHKWGFIRREAVKVNPAGIEVPVDMEDHHWVEAHGLRLPIPGFRVADPGEKNAEGNWRGHSAPTLVSELYEQHIVRGQK